MLYDTQGVFGCLVYFYILWSVRISFGVRVKMEKIYEQTLLYDFYGELLTEHQRSIYEDAIYNDMSLGEIAQEQGISRQGVHDLIKRCDKILQDYESKLHLVERFARAKEKIAEIEKLTGLLEKETEDYPSVRQIRQLAKELQDTI